MSKNLDTKIGKVRAFLEEGNTITSWQSIKMFDYTRLAAGVKYLKDNYDMNIESKMVYEEDTKYAKYWLTSDPQLKEEIKDFLLRGNKISEKSAEELFDCNCLKVVINELREEGINIVSEYHRPLCGEPYIRYHIK